MNPYNTSKGLSKDEFRDLLLGLHPTRYIFQLKKDIFPGCKYLHTPGVIKGVINILFYQVPDGAAQIPSALPILATS